MEAAQHGGSPRASEDKAEREKSPPGEESERNISFSHFLIFQKEKRKKEKNKILKIDQTRLYGPDYFI